MVVRPECSASSICCGQMKWIWAVEAPCGQDPALPRDRLGPRADDDVDTGLGIGVAGLADFRNPPVAQAHIGLIDAGMVKDHRIGDDRVHRPVGPRRLGLAHAVADHLAAAELHLLAIGGQVAFDLDDQIGVRQANPVPVVGPNMAA
jgi:hypothetical protein